jgi:hypothetical protein
VIAEAPKAFPALRKLFRDQFPPLLRALDPFLRNLNPILTGLGLYKHELTALLGNVAATTNGVLPIENKKGERKHYLRAMGPLTPDSLATYVRRLTSNRASAYSPPLWAEGLASGLPAFETRQCGSGIVATLNPETPSNPDFKARTKHGDEREATDLFNRLKKYAFAEQTSTATLPAPACTQQSPFEPIGKPGPATTYQHAYFQQGQ